MLSVFVVSICFIQSIHSVKFKDVSIDVLHQVYRYLENEERHQVFPLINNKMLSIHRLETMETKQLMDEMKFYFELLIRQSGGSKDAIQRIRSIHNKLWLNERYHATLPLWNKQWKRIMQRPGTLIRAYEEIASFMTSQLGLRLVHDNSLLTQLAMCSRRIAHDNTQSAATADVPQPSFYGAIDFLLYSHLWNHIVTKTTIPLPPLDSVYYLKENEGSNSEKIRYLKHLEEEDGLILIHHRFRNPNFDDIRGPIPVNFISRIVQHLSRGYGIQGQNYPDSEWTIPLTAKLLTALLHNDSEKTKFHQMVKWKTKLERTQYEGFMDNFHRFMDQIFEQNDDESNEMLRGILIGLQRHHAVFCTNHQKFLSRIPVLDDRYINFVGTMIHTLSNDMDFKTALEVARSIGEWRLQEVRWGETGTVPNLTESMNILYVLTEDEQYDGKLPNQLIHLLSPQSDLLWNLVRDTDGYLRWALAVLKDGLSAMETGKLRVHCMAAHWFPRSSYKY